nr:hypothetical protein RTCK_00791 [Rhizobium sp. TCK]CAD6620519.1 hypothetical protein RNT25_03965 [arsenite-oxidising bacterium NT-25]
MESMDHVPSLTARSRPGEVPSHRACSTDVSTDTAYTLTMDRKRIAI